MHWLLPHEKYGVPFKYPPGKKYVHTVADASSPIDINSLKNQEEEELTLLSGLENSSTNSIKLMIPMYTPLIFKEQAKVKDTRSREMCMA
jgi:hypothetical protein